MTRPAPILLGDGLTIWMLEHPVLGIRCVLGCPATYCSREQAERALEREVERQRRDGWRVLRVRVTPDACSLCGEPWVVGHECPREA